MATLNENKSSTSKFQTRMKANRKIKDENALHSKKKFNNITIIGRRWFDKPNGNTYHSTEVYVDGKFIGKKDFEYGYDEGYVQSGHKILQENGYYPTREEGGEYWDFSKDRRNHHDKILTSVSDVERKRDL
jgi:hypothetical protein